MVRPVRAPYLDLGSGRHDAGEERDREVEMTGHLSYLAANERVADMHRAAENHRAAKAAKAPKVESPATGSQRDAAARVPRRWALLGRRFKAV
jgi:hypothetical protein